MKKIRLCRPNYLFPGIDQVDKNSYRFILGNLIVNGLCSITELSKALDKNRKNIERYAKTPREKGAGQIQI